jgi:hypothetical protein
VSSTVQTLVTDLPAGAVAVDAGGLLSRVSRKCSVHEVESACVARYDHEQRLIFWCAAGAHHFTAPQ